MKLGNFLFILLNLGILNGICAQNSPFIHQIETSQKPWTSSSFKDDPESFQFAIVSDRTGGHREGIFGKAIEKLNLLMPEFVMSVGDLIEGSMYPDTIQNQWEEFDSLLNPLEMRFFFVPGNHDIANNRMRQVWKKRFGHTYFHFIYKNVLFLAFDSTDGDEDATFSDEQITYFKQILEANQEVKWTLIFMHHPIWRYKTADRFAEIEAQLKNRPYTVFAGHNHTYLQATRKERNYYVLATTGGGSRLRGPNFGEFDHVTWISMTPDGPKMLNLRLEGMLSHDISPEVERKKRTSLIAATDFKAVMLKNKEENAGLIHLDIENSSNDTLFFNGRIYHNHHLALSQTIRSLPVAPHSTEKWLIPWKREGKMPLDMIDPVEVHFSLGYHPEIGEPPFQIEGTFMIPQVIKEKQIAFTEPLLFIDQSQVNLVTEIEGLAIHYTTDGTEPDKDSPIFQSPILLDTSTSIKAVLIDSKTGFRTDYLETFYKKVSPLQPSSKRNTKPGLRYSYYQGNFLVLPNFDTLTVTKTGIAQDFEVSAIESKRIDHYALVYEGYLEVQKEGLYTFYSHSDDGSKVYLHDEVVVDNDGSHSARTRHGYIALKKGKHPIRIEYFEDFLGQELNLFMKAPGHDKREELTFDKLSH